MEDDSKIVDPSRSPPTRARKSGEETLLDGAIAIEPNAGRITNENTQGPEKMGETHGSHAASLTEGRKADQEVAPQSTWLSQRK